MQHEPFTTKCSWQSSELQWGSLTPTPSVRTLTWVRCFLCVSLCTHSCFTLDTNLRCRLVCQWCIFTGCFLIPTYVRIGRVLNRFSKDLGFMDDILPFYFFNYLAVSEQNMKSIHHHWLLCQPVCFHFSLLAHVMYNTASLAVAAIASSTSLPPDHASLFCCHDRCWCCQRVCLHSCGDCHRPASTAQILLPCNIKGDQEAGSNWCVISVGSTVLREDMILSYACIKYCIWL